MTEHAKSGFASLEEVADAVSAYNPHRPRPDDLSGLRKNVREIDGRLVLALGSGLHRRRAPAGHPSRPCTPSGSRPAWRSILDHGTPMMLVRGRSSDLVVGGRRDASSARRFPAVEFVDVSGAGHMVAGDRNDAFTSAVVDFLDEHR